MRAVFQRAGKRPARRQRQKQAGKPAVVETTAYEKDGRLFVQIANSCSFPVQFDAQGVPTTSQPGHGLGVRSICAIVEQYGGMYSFARAAGSVRAAHFPVKGRFNAFYGRFMPNTLLPHILCYR